MSLRALVDQLSAMLAYWDSAQQCRFANRAYQQGFGVAPELMVGRTLRELWGSLYERERPYVEGALLALKI